MSTAATAEGSVVVFGSANHDHVLAVDAFPVPGETILSSSYSDGLGGKGANQAVAAVRAGADVVFVGAVGGDNAGTRILDRLADGGINVERVRRHEGERTGQAFVIVDGHGSNEIIVAAGANAALAETSVAAAIDTIRPGDVIVVQCEIPVDRVLQVITDGAARGAFVIVNLAPFTALPREVYAQIGLLVVNESEASALLGTDSSQDLASQIVAELGCSCIVTLGERGSIFAHVLGTRLTVEATAVDRVVDTTGAGDVYVGTLAALLARRSPVEDAMRAASVAAARSVSSAGAQTQASTTGHALIG